MKFIFSVLTVSALVFATAIVPAFGVEVVVPSRANPWLAGMPNGTTEPYGDVAPFQSPVLVDLDLSKGNVLTFTAEGWGHYGPVWGCIWPGWCTPDGRVDGIYGSEFGPHAASKGKSAVTAPWNALMGVLLDDAEPTEGEEPEGLNFSSIGVDFASLSPKLGQVFFIGDGFTGKGSGDVQTFIIPEGATRLFLGTMDGAEWNNNVGSFTVNVQVTSVNVQVTPENQAPIANAGVDQTVIVGEIVMFDGSASSDPDGEILDYEWNFRDGTTRYNETTDHIYKSAGEYSVNLTVEDDDGATDTDTITVIVLTPGEAAHNLIFDIEASNLPQKIENSLVSKLDSAISSLDDGKENAAENKLNAFINQIEAQRGKKITDEEADALVSAAQRIIDNI
ncbi:MAG: PKD domain-containing protein [Deltaproteobacteria bacterium]|nr:MAG: PKD domain-containing protein [Deltaproteobacteria bacterium]